MALAAAAIFLVPPVLAGIGAARGHWIGEVAGAIACLPLGLIARNNLADAIDLPARVALTVVTAGFLGAAVLLAMAVGRRMRTPAAP